MAIFKKQYILLIALAVFAFMLIFPENSLAGTIYKPGDCKTQEKVKYCTECDEYFNECFTVGSCKKVCCKWNDEGKCIKECWTCCANKNWDEYRCDSPNCDGDILIRHCRSFVDCEDCPNSCNDKCVCVECSDPEVCEECQSWQKPIDRPCQPCTRWGLKKPECLCDGECLDRPENPRYYNHPLYPLDECNVEKEYQTESDNIYLPVKLDWDDVKGWRQGWKDGVCQQVLDCQSETRACIEKSEKLKNCKKDCRGSCLNEAGKAVFNGYWLTPYKIPEFYKSCIRDCEDDCQNQYKTGAKGCSATCPEITAKGDKCYLQPEGYAQSYLIKIEGEMRNCEALKEIDELEKFIEEEKRKENPNWQKIEQYKKEIKNIRKDELPMNATTTVLNRSEFIPPCSCMFESNRTYNWKVRACCPVIKEIITMDELKKMCPDCCPAMLAKKAEDLRKEGIWVEDDLDEVCGDWSDDWQFTTNPAPEPKLPYDPDWVGIEEAKKLPATMSVEWCSFADCEENLTYEDCRNAWQKRGVRCYWDYDLETCRIYSYQFITYLIENDKEICHPHLLFEEGICYPKLLKPFSPGATPDVNYHPNKFSNEIYKSFTKHFTYSWQAATCKDDIAQQCTDFGQKWKFSLADLILIISSRVSPPNDPQGNNPVGLPVYFQWFANLGTMSYWYEIYEKDSSVLIDRKSLIPPEISFDSPPLKINTVYKWRVKPCWGYFGETEKCGDNWSEFFFFKTTGQPPKLISPENNALEVVIPVTFKWEGVGGAKSYIFKINEEERIVDKPEITLDYPDLKQEINYAWQVKTCARYNGELCGDWSDKYQFTTFKLKTPANPKPKDGDTISTTETHRFSWDKVEGAKYYQFQIKYSKVSTEEGRKECLEKEGETITKIVSENSIHHQLECNGEYQWQVRGCLAANCEPESVGEWNTPWVFTLISKKTIQEVLEETLTEVLINEVYPQIFEKIPAESAERVAEIVSASTSEIVSKYFPNQIAEETINKLSGYASTSQILENLEPKFNEVWEEKSTKAVAEASIVPEVPEKVLEEVLKQKGRELSTKIATEVNDEINKRGGADKVSPSEALTIIEDVIYKNLEGVAQKITEEVSNRVSQKVLEVTKEMPQNLLKWMLDKILEEVLKISKPEEVPAMIEEISNEFEEEWKEESVKVISKASAMPEVPEQVLSAVLAAMAGEVSEKTFETLEEKVAEKIPGVPARVEMKKGGLVPCGRTSDNPDTPWIETEPCGIKHIFILIKNIIDFLLGKLAPLLLVLLMVYSGVIFYLSLKMEAPTPIAKVKSLWKAAGIGYGIIFFAWIIIDLILKIFGYNVGVFGPWWEL